MRANIVGGRGALVAAVALPGFLGAPAHAASPHHTHYQLAAARSRSLISTRRFLIPFVPGHRLLYTVQMSNQAGLDLRAALQRQNPNAVAPAAPMMALNTSLRGTIEVFAISKTQALCSIGPDDLRIQANGRDAMEQLLQLKWELSQPVLAQFTDHGRIASLRFDPKCSTTAQGFARTLLAYLQVSAAPDGGNAKTWKAKEEEPNGVFVSTYSLQSRTKSDVVLRKTKQPASSPAVVESSHRTRAAKTVTPTGTLTIDFDSEHGIIKTVRGDEVFGTTLGTVFVSRSHNAILIQLQHQSLAGAAQLKSLLQLARARTEQTQGLPLAQETEITPQQEAQIQRANLGSATWDDLSRQLAALDGSSSANKPAQALLPRLKACIYLHPEVCPSLQMLLVSTRTTGIKLALIVESLRAAGGPQAQQTLIAAMQARRTDQQMMVLFLSALAQLEAPTPQVDAALLEQFCGNADPFISSTACLALGILTHTLAQSAPDRSHKILKLLEQHLQSAHSAEQKATLLLALANAAQPSTLSLLLRQAQDASPRVRGGSLLALGRLPGEQANRKICSALALDMDAQVRLAAATAAKGRLKSALVRQVLLAALRRDKDAQVRLTALNALWNGARQESEVYESVQAAALHDASTDIRKAAASLLAQK